MYIIHKRPLNLIKINFKKSIHTYCRLAFKLAYAEDLKNNIIYMKVIQNYLKIFAIILEPAKTLDKFLL